MSNIKHTTSYLYNVISLGLIAMVIFSVAKITFYTLMPYSFWFEYDAIKPVKSEYIAGEQLLFDSVRVVKRDGINIQWIDVLMCNIIGDYEEEFTRFSSDVSFRNNTPKTPKQNMNKSGMEVAQWRYTQTKPTPPRTCYIDSTITVLHPFGITDSQSIISENFLIK